MSSETSYDTRYGNLANNVFQLHCILIANHHISWFIPTGRNYIQWQTSGWNYMMKLYQWYREHRTPQQPIYNNLELFSKAILKQELVLSTEALLTNLSESQKDHLLSYYILHREESILPIQYFQNENRIQSSILNLNQSLWIGAGYCPSMYS